MVHIVANGVHYKVSLKKIRKSKNQLQPVFEAFTNSIEAIKILQRKRDIVGKITVRIEYKGNLFPGNEVSVK